MTDLVTKIKAGYEREIALGPLPVTKAEELPLNYEAITDEWLTDVLCAAHPGAKVLSHTLGPVDDGSTNRRKIQLVYNQAGQEAGLPDRLFCKSTHSLASRMLLGLAGGVDIESDFYRLIRPHVNIEAPEAVYCKVNHDTFNSMIMLKDISQLVTSFCDHKTVMNRARAESQMRLLAALHGAGYANDKVRASFGRYSPWPDYFDRMRAFDIQTGSEAGVQDGRDVIPARLFARADEIWPGTEKSLALQRNLPATFAHGDVHLKNWYIAGNGEMGLGDWQCCNLGHWSRDVAYAIATALTVEDRRAWESELLKLYIDELARHGGPRVAFDEAWLNYRQQMITALTWWTITLHPSPGIPDMQPHDVAVEFVRRIATAMDDIGTLDALRD